MLITPFGRTGLSVSRLCLGTGTFEKQTDEGDKAQPDVLHGVAAIPMLEQRAGVFVMPAAIH